MISCIRYVRGQVWFRKMPEPIDNYLRDSSSHITWKSRPVIILSSTQSMLQTGIATVVPLTTNVDNLNGNNVIYEDYTHRKVRALCEQVTTVDVKELNTYLYTVPDELLQEIWKKMQIYFEVGDLFQAVKTISTMKPMATIVRGDRDDPVVTPSVDVEHETSSAKESETDSDDDDDHTKTSKKKSQNEKVTTHEPKKSSEEKDIPKRVYHKWTHDEMIQFLVDQYKLDAKEVQLKYGLSRKQIQERTKRFQKKMRPANQQQFDILQ